MSNETVRNYECELRDKFALAAMQAMISPDPKLYSNIDIDSVAKLAYQQAEEMLRKRKDRNL